MELKNRDKDDYYITSLKEGVDCTVLNSNIRVNILPKTGPNQHAARRER